jgi:DNA-directed RNA polymerase I, II, and III subunit RPABC5
MTGCCPIRCFNCGKVLSNLHHEYSLLLEKGISESDALKKLNIRKYCCRALVLSHVELIDKLIKYPTPVSLDKYNDLNA